MFPRLRERIEEARMNLEGLLVCVTCLSFVLDAVILGLWEV